MLIDRVQAPGRPPRADLGRGRRPRRVRHPARARPPAPSASASCPRAEKGELVKQLGAAATSTATSSPGMMRRGDETPEEEKARFDGHPRVRQARQGACSATRPTSSSSTSARRRSRPRSSPSSRSARSSSAARRRATPRLRRPLPVDAPEGDPRLALRQRVGVHEGQRAHRAAARSGRCCGVRWASTRSRRPTSSCTRTSTSARSPSSSARPRRARASTAAGPGAIRAEVGG